MRSPLLYIRNFIKMSCLKIRFGAGFHAGAIQTFDRLHVEITHGGKISLGSYDQNRGNLYLVCDGGKLDIGDHCFFNTGCSVSALESITIGSGCKFGNNTVLVDHDHNYKSLADDAGMVNEFISSPVCIGNDVWVGANATILRGSSIGNNCVIAAGSVVKGDIPDDSIYINGTIKKIS